MSYKNYVYKSVRVNGFSEIDESSSYGNLTLALEHKKLVGRKFNIRLGSSSKKEQKEQVIYGLE
ncbi:MAG: hypothetical protein GW809_06270 [Bacteroidetes bacterium]|nr:hypothetical protein [Bacteroidota bacterium]NCQ11741.1 hypothetical protein [Bacteroidota bacterium]